MKEIMTTALFIIAIAILVVAIFFLYKEIIKPIRLWKSIKKGETLTFFEKCVDPFQETHEVYVFKILNIAEGYVQYHQYHYHDLDDYRGLKQSDYNWDIISSMKGVDLAHWLVRLQKDYTLERS